MNQKKSIQNPKPVGTETKVENVLGNYATVCNWGKEMAYVSCNSGITAGADGVMPVPAGCSGLIAHNGTLYILGNGDVTVIGSNDPVNFIKPVVGGGSTDGTAISNPNLLVNPDLAINQRGQEEYTGKAIYTVDHWRLHATDGTTFNAADKTITIPQNDNSAWYGILQYLEYDLAGKTVTVSADIETDVDIYFRFTYGTSNSTAFTILIPAGYSGVTEMCNCVIPETATKFSVQLTNLNKSTSGGTCKVNWAKVELGSVATPFISPDPAMELAKCQRYYQVRSTGGVASVDLRPCMAGEPVITQLADGKYSYSAEL